jgi:hypothetical protein
VRRGPASSTWPSLGYRRQQLGCGEAAAGRTSCARDGRAEDETASPDRIRSGREDDVDATDRTCPRDKATASDGEACDTADRAGETSTCAQERSRGEILALATLIAIAIHSLSLLGDPWLHASVLDVTVPFAGSFETLPTAIGIIAGWGMVILGLSYYARRRIGQARWKTIHRFTAVAWLLGLVHTFAEGSDVGKLWFIALIVVTAGPSLVLLIVRHARGPARVRVVPLTQSR